MLSIKKTYVVDEHNHPVAVQMIVEELWRLCQSPSKIQYA